jgi:hypothetical protein
MEEQKMAFYLSPQVALLEKDLSNTIPAVATSIGGIVLRNTYKGPERKTIYVTSESTLVDTFGWPTSAASCYRDILSACGYLKYGNSLYCTRVMSDNATFAGIVAVSSSQAVSLSAGVTNWTSMCPASGAPSAVGVPSAYSLDDLQSWDPDQFPEDINWSDYASDVYPFVVLADSRGAHGNNVRLAVIDYYTSNRIAASGATVFSSWATSAAFAGLDSPVEDTKSFVIIVEAMGQGSTEYETVETWNVSTDPTAVDDMGINRFIESLNSKSRFIRVALNPIYKNNVIACSTSSWIQMGGGSNGTGSDALTTQCISGYSLYSNPEEIDVNIFIDSDKALTVKRYLIDVCEARMDSMAILDVPYESVVFARGNVEEGLRRYVYETLNANTSYAAIYGNWLEVYDKWNSKYRWIPSSGHVAGVYANTDSVSDPWFAPAGLNRAQLTSVRRLAFNPKQGQRDLMYKYRINPVVGFAGQGQVIWGQKTLLDKESAFNRVNVRRLFIVLEKAIATAAKYFLFEPNDVTTRMLLVNMIDPFLRDVKARRGIYRFQIVCDETNNTNERMDRNELYCDIYIQPTRTVEFLVLSFIATKTGVSFNELAGSSLTI